MPHIGFLVARTLTVSRKWFPLKTQLRWRCLLDYGIETWNLLVMNWKSHIFRPHNLGSIQTPTKLTAAQRPMAAHSLPDRVWGGAKQSKEIGNKSKIPKVSPSFYTHSSSSGSLIHIWMFPEKWWYPKKWSIFSRKKTPWLLNYQHFRKLHPHLFMFLYFMPFHSVEKSTIRSSFTAASTRKSSSSRGLEPRFSEIPRPNIWDGAFNPK